MGRNGLQELGGRAVVAHSLDSWVLDLYLCRLNGLDLAQVQLPILNIGHAQIGHRNKFGLPRLSPQVMPAAISATSRSGTTGQLFAMLMYSSLDPTFTVSQ